MALLFACPYCKTETMIDDAYVGQSGPCAICGRIVAVPQQQVPTKTPGVVMAKPPAQTGQIIMLIAVVIGSLFAGAAVIGITVAIVAPALATARVAAYKTQSGSNLEQIAQALEQYHVKHGSYPPAITTDKNGKPMHSWRVLILQELGYHQLYRQYDFNQPWDQGVNATLVMQMPEVFAAPGDDAARISKETSYMVVVGRETMFPGPNKSRTRDQATDGISSTVLVVESSRSGVCWMEPKDLDAQKMNYTVNGAPSGCIRGEHPDGASVVMVDGKARFLSKDEAAEFVEALLTAAKGDAAPMEILGTP